MKRTNTTLGLTLLLVAAAVALYSTDESDQFVAPEEDENANHARGGSGWTPASAKSSVGRRSSDRLPSFLEEYGVEAVNRDAGIIEQAARVQKRALHRTRDLTEDLNLTPNQQQQVFALSARSHPEYHRGMWIKGVPASSERGSIDLEAARDALYDILDLDQQLEFEISELEEYAWWKDILRRLERELRRNTPAPAVPDRHPAPEREEAPTPIGPRPQPTSVRGSSLFGGTRD